MHILLLEDDLQFAQYIAQGLREAGHQPRHCADGAEGLLVASSEAFDVIVLDRMLPGMDGLQLLRAWRARGDATPVLILSALGDVDERVTGLKAGGDDYLAKPFALPELLARIEVLARRRPLAAEQRLAVADLEIDLLARMVRRGGRRIELTTREFRILEFLVRNTGRVVTRAMLLEHVWDYHFDPQTNIIDQHVSRLRQKIDREPCLPLIETVRGTGYRIRMSA